VLITSIGFVIAPAIMVLIPPLKALYHKLIIVIFLSISL